MNSETERRYSKEFTNLTLLNILYYVVSLLLIPITISVLALLMLWKSVVYIIVVWKHGKSFKGFLSGCDALVSTNKKEDAILQGVMLLEGDKNIDYLCFWREYLRTIFQKYKKLTYLRKNILGYYFWKAREINVENHVRIVDIAGQDLDEAINKYYCTDLPDNNESLCEIIIGDFGSENPEKKLILVIFKVDHSVADGISLTAMFLDGMQMQAKALKCLERNYLSALNINNPDPVRDTSKNKRKCTNAIAFLKNNFEFMVNCILFILMVPGFMLCQKFTKKSNENISEGTEDPEGNIVKWIREDECYLIAAIKRIKNRFKVSFNDVIVTAFSAALHEFMSKKMSNLPKYTTMLIPVRMEALKATQELKNNDIYSIFAKADFSNDFSFTFMEIPIRLSTGNETQLLERLFEVRHQAQLSVKSSLIQRYYLLLITASYFPLPFIRYIFKRTIAPVVLSNVPGPKKEVLLINQFRVKDCHFLLPKRAGLSIGLSTYAGRLQLSLLADKTVMSKEDDAHELLKNIHKYVKKMDILSEEMTSLYLNEIHDKKL